MGREKDSNLARIEKFRQGQEYSPSNPAYIKRRVYNPKDTLTMKKAITYTLLFSSVILPVVSANAGKSRNIKSPASTLKKEIDIAFVPNTPYEGRMATCFATSNTAYHMHDYSGKNSPSENLYHLQQHTKCITEQTTAMTANEIKDCFEKGTSLVGFDPSTQRTVAVVEKIAYEEVCAEKSHKPF